MRIERHPAVTEKDLPGIYAHIARENPVAAERVLDAVAQTFMHISADPEIGVLYPAQNLRMEPVRMLPVTGFNNYLVLYKVETEAIRILYVVHGARLLPRLFGRERRE